MPWAECNCHVGGQGRAEKISVVRTNPQGALMRVGWAAVMVPLGLVCSACC